MKPFLRVVKEKPKLSSFEVLGVFWFVEGGIAKVKEKGKVKYYIRGLGFGKSESMDARKIVEQGTEFPSDAAEILFLKGLSA